MINKTLVSSGYDIEIILSENYLKFILLNLYETGTIPSTYTASEDSTTSIFIYPPNDISATRLYEPNSNYNYNPFDLELEAPITEDAFQVSILSEGTTAEIRIRCRFAIWPDLPYALSGDLFGTISLIADEVDGFQENVRLKTEITAIELGSFDNEDLVGYGTSLEEILELIKEKADKELPLSFVGENKSVHSIAMQSYLASDDKAAGIGLYINLKLKNGPGPDSYVESRGSLSDAQNFLETDDNVSFALKGDMYNLLNTDLRQRMAKLTSICPEEYSDNFDIEGYTAEIRGTSILPVYKKEDENDPNSPMIPTNQLRITIHLEVILDDMIDPDVYLYFTLTPVIDENNILTWNISFDFSSFLLTLLTIGAFVVSLITLNPIPIIVFVGLVVGPEILEYLAEDYIKGNVMDVNILETFTNKVTIEKKRWDPLYETHHQIQTSISQLEISHDGFFMSGSTLWLGKDIVKDVACVLRNLERNDPGDITRYNYSANKISTTLNQLTQEFIATDRMPYDSIIDATANEGILVSLTEQQLTDRMTANKIQRLLTYSPRKADIENGKIRYLLVLSETEYNGIRSTAIRQLKNELTDADREELMNTAIQTLEEQGCGSTDEFKIDTMYSKLVNERIADAIQDRFEIVLNNLCRLELSPYEAKKMSDLNIMKIVNSKDGREYELVVMKSGTVYFRDYKDGDQEDNLLSLPGYNSSDLPF